MGKQAEAFKLSVPAADIADLRKRLARTRFPTGHLVRPGRTAPMSNGCAG